MSDVFEAKTPHFDKRKPVFLIVHGIGTSYEEADKILSGKTEYEASAHYLIAQDGTIIQYLDEFARAWHAGASYWSGIMDLNSISIGIELESKPVITEEKDFHLTHYTDKQIEVLAGLINEITKRYRISPWSILGHQDISPYRKYDPGPNFNWALLAKHGVGLWHDLNKTAEDAVITDERALADFKLKLSTFGYDPRPVEGKDYSDVIRAFQIHFLPWNICGQVTAQSVQALDILLAKKFA